MSSASEQPAPQNPRSIAKNSREANSITERIIADVDKQPLPSFVADKSIENESILDQIMDGPLKWASLPIQELDEMDVEDVDSERRASNNEASPGGSVARKRRRVAPSPTDPLKRCVSDSRLRPQSVT